jgi:hypothetical protein
MIFIAFLSSFGVTAVVKFVFDPLIEKQIEKQFATAQKNIDQLQNNTSQAMMKALEAAGEAKVATEEAIKLTKSLYEN